MHEWQERVGDDPTKVRTNGVSKCYSRGEWRCRRVGNILPSQISSHFWRKKLRHHYRCPPTSSKKKGGIKSFYEIWSLPINCGRVCVWEPHMAQGSGWSILERTFSIGCSSNLLRRHGTVFIGEKLFENRIMRCAVMTFDGFSFAAEFIHSHQFITKHFLALSNVNSSVNCVTLKKEKKTAIIMSWSCGNETATRQCGRWDERDFKQRPRAKEPRRGFS